AAALEKDSPHQLHRHVGHSAFSDMYEPAEGTFLLLDVLKAAAVELTGMEIHLKVGLGSGVVPEFLASMIGPLALAMCSAVNPEAAVCTLEMVCCNKAHTQSIITDFKRSTRDHCTFQTGEPRDPFSPQVHQALISKCKREYTICSMMKEIFLYLFIFAKGSKRINQELMKLVTHRRWVGTEGEGRE
uniref:Uncharacterized protein n=1 Tax=Moschus moschiferus TaxID=68415 RepID=A0A8C6CXG2_MOSMO